MKLPRLSMVHGLFAALVVGAGFAVYESTSSSASAVSPAAEPIASAPTDKGTAPRGAAPLGDEPSQATGGTIEGEVLEVLDVPQYTYARLGKKGSEGSWTAFPSTKVEVGQHLKLRDAALMTDFSSKVLNRTFQSIWFGNLDDGRVASENPHETGNGNLAPMGMGTGADSQAPVQVHPVEKASGPNGKTVAEIVAGRTDLAGKKVRLRAIVVKRTEGVLGHDYLHVRDGSGDETQHTNDLSVTTDMPTSLGATVLIEGTLALDVDIGSGYKFPTLVQDAKLITP